MKNRIIALLAIIAVFGLALFAYAQTASVNSAGSSCCSKDWCPMKKKDAGGKENASCCDKCDCCKEGKCTGDSCPMKKKDGEARATSGSASDEGKNCCDNCACCKGKHDHGAEMRR